MTEQERSVAPAGWLDRHRWPLAMWSALTVAVLLVQYASRLVGDGKSRSLLDGLVQFDGPEYLAIAAEGYTQPQLVWFPLYPSLLGIVARVVQDPILAGVLVSIVAGGVAVLLLWRWTDVLVEPSARTTVLAVVLLYPYGWFLYGVVYSDALFVALVTGAFLAVERDRLWVAALAGAAATATRPSGFAVAMGLWLLTLERAGVLRVPGPGAGWIHRLRLPLSLDRSAWRARLLVPLLSFSGLVVYMTYLWVRWGDPVAFLTEQRRYHAPGHQTLLKQQYFDAFYQGYDGRHLATTTAQGLLVMVVLASVPAVGRRFGWGYGALVLGLGTLPMVSVATFMGTGRYLMPAFPAFALFGEWLSRRTLARAVWLSLSGVALAVMVFGFSRSWYLT